MGNSMSASFAPECTELKKTYDNCFNEWYSEKFLKGKSVENECSKEWYAYIGCVNENLKKKSIQSALDDARKEAPFERGGELVDDNIDNKKKSK
ncbi:similar to Saccharomyces cerevisiae YKL053C-A MDM35 Mitochondrial intermembrane space protein [Maudiozyma saulgeensis]|uniref:Similar to Saccharomyces cerevisiae YKL053C-A MDM35 Mitochondrial intermembrane space protein n=1 Tax=Maudiozyma saulgeensis TaxID=1789683 RepID=A0A1X7QWF0_9SACH|nr:similar to Saccharomyces cerevisiae YKL053C-A MDM35 Mitochondrial intermembrane space protein [Kazachstania saulgeensis]